MPAPPSRDDISGSGSTPSNGQARDGFGKMWDTLFSSSGGLLGTTGLPADARAALGVPSTASFASSNTPSGWQKLPSGLIVQWMTVQNNNALGTGFSRHNWPIAFPNECLSVASMVKTSSSKSYEMGSATVVFAQPNYIDWVGYRDSNVPENRGVGWCEVALIAIGR